MIHVLHRKRRDAPQHRGDGNLQRVRPEIYINQFPAAVKNDAHKYARHHGQGEGASQNPFMVRILSQKEDEHQREKKRKQVLKEEKQAACPVPAAQVAVDIEEIYDEE